LNKKRILVLVVIVGLAVLVYLQFRTWRRFDWAKFKEGTEGIRYLPVLYAIFFIYLADFLRAVRWKIFLRPTKPDASWTGLISPQYVGFTGLALLGRPGEFVRPYLIAMKENVSFPSQLAIWFVERAFDIGAVTVILTVDIFLVPQIRENYPYSVVAGYVLIAAFILFTAFNWALWRHGTPIAPSLEKKLLAVSAGMNTIHDVISFLELAIISLGIWLLVALAYREVTHAYPAETGLPYLNLPEVALLMGASVAGGVVQLPVIGGGSQLATIFVISNWFGYEDSPELAVSCGILLWLVTFMSVVPLGLILARREHLSLRELSAESEEEAEGAGPVPENGGPPG
jgi:glycosyltransferase 2 family protein